MSGKKYTLILVSNRRGTTRRFQLSVAWAKAIAVLSFLGLIVFAGAAVDYLGLLVHQAENKRLKIENASLRRQFNQVEGKLSALEGGLERVQTFVQKLRLITNLEDDERSLKLSLGPNKREDLDQLREPLEQREPASELMVKESSFLEKAPLDRASGELSQRRVANYGSLSVRIDRAVKKTELREQGILELWELLSERQNLLSATPSIKPARGWFTSRFGYRVDPFTGRTEMHAGLDIAASRGTPVYSPADGVVSYVGFESGYGKLVSIDHGYGVISRFAHNSRIYVEKGQKVRRKDVISAVGSTGRSSGPHLHYEIRVHGVPVDPMNYILTE